MSDIMRDLIVQSLKPLHSNDPPDEPVGDHTLNARRPVTTALKQAAVLVPIVERSSGPTVLLTQRTDHLKHHAGQISFPGGRVEPEDSDAVATALRESHEEIGLAAQYVEVVGRLDNYQTGTGFMVTPIVGFVRPDFALQLDDFEVAEAFEVPLDFVLNPDNHVIESRPWQGSERRYYVLRFEQRFIWGATAGMLVNLSRRTRGLTP